MYSEILTGMRSCQTNEARTPRRQSHGEYKTKAVNLPRSAAARTPVSFLRGLCALSTSGEGMLGSSEGVEPKFASPSGNKSNNKN
jgi:hypothetical protein